MQKVVESLLQSGNPEKAMEILEKSRLPMIDAGEHEVVGKLLNELAASMPGTLEPLEWLVELYGRTSDSFRLPDALAHLGDALVAGHQWERAKQIFQQLVDRDPDSDSAKRKLNGVLRKMGQLPAGEAEDFPEENLRAEIPKAPAAKLPVDDEEEPTPEVSVKPAAVSSEPALDEETEKFIAQSLTDVDLFASYGLTQKAIGLLEAILRRAPRHTPTLEKLLDFVLGAGDDRRTAELAAQLEQIHTETGDKRSAERFAELRRRFQRAAGLSDEELASAAAPAKPGSAAEPAAADEPAETAIPEITAVPRNQSLLRPRIRHPPPGLPSQNLSRPMLTPRRRKQKFRKWICPTSGPRCSKKLRRRSQARPHRPRRQRRKPRPRRRRKLPLFPRVRKSLRMSRSVRSAESQRLPPRRIPLLRLRPFH